MILLKSKNIILKWSTWLIHHCQLTPTMSELLSNWQLQKNNLPVFYLYLLFTGIYGKQAMAYQKSNVCSKQSINNRATKTNERSLLLRQTASVAQKPKTTRTILLLFQ